MRLCSEVNFSSLFFLFIQLNFHQGLVFVLLQSYNMLHAHPLLFLLLIISLPSPQYNAGNETDGDALSDLLIVAKCLFVLILIN